MTTAAAAAHDSAGRGMSAFGLKGGIGSASRRVWPSNEAPYCVGSLVLANHGRRPQLLLAGQPLGAQLPPEGAPAGDGGAAIDPERGSIILLLATDAPLDARQLRRLALRTAAGLARSGSVFGHGSGDIALAFCTAYTLPHLPSRTMPALAMLHDALLDGLFQAVADASELAIVHALWHADTVIGHGGHRRSSLREALAGAPPARG